MLLRVPRWVLTALCTATIVYLTLVPKPLPDNDIPWWEHTDKVVHAIMFGGLYFCAAIDLRRGRRIAWPRRLPLVAAVAAFGAIIEIAQGAMALGRGASAGDWLADLGGTLLVSLFI